MTIQQFLKRLARPYTFFACVFILVFLIGAGGMRFTLTQGPNGGNQELHSRLVLIFSAMFLVGGLGLIAVPLLASFKVRCPKCGTILGLLPTRWDSCPFCAVEFDSKLEYLIESEER